MSFNVKYILPGDDKTQIISKVNQNFSQVYYAGVGLQGEKGVIGPTGIIGQVGKDGSQGPTGERANIWIFQNDPPGIYTEYPIPLENYDVWVNTSPTGSTGGLNRIYRYQSNYGGGDFGFFWIDTGDNFTAGDVFTIVQGVSGPGQISSRNSIVAGATSTFVFTDREVTEGNANPTYAKVLIENKGFTTAELPVLGLGKTFYTDSGAPSFIWKNTTDYGLEFSSGGDISIQSQATGHYASTGGNAGITAGNNINITSSTNLGITGPSGIGFQTVSLGIKSSNFNHGSDSSLSGMNSGVSIEADSSGYSLVAENSLPLASGDTRILTVAEFSGGPSGGILRPNISLGMTGFSIFRINNASSGSYPALSIGYTGGIGSTGPSGGTGANVYKSYQTVTDSASSRLSFGTGSPSNYIQVTPSNDVIRVAPSVAPGSSISSNGRNGRIWIYLTNVFNYIEFGNNSEIDIFMDSTEYSIGGVAIETNYSGFFSIYGQLQISDGGTGPSSGCRHVKINLFGAPLPSNVNNSGNRFAYIQPFVSGNNTSSQVVYFYSSFPFTGGGGIKVICTELYSQGYMSEKIRSADEEYGLMMLETRPHVMIGYHLWAIPVVRMMKKSKNFTRAVWFFAKPWANQMAYEMGVLEKGNIIGKILMEIGIFFSGGLGILFSKKIINSKKTSGF
jgi:hypothetical protein